MHIERVLLLVVRFFVFLIVALVPFALCEIIIHSTGKPHMIVHFPVDEMVLVSVLLGLGALPCPM